MLPNQAGDLMRRARRLARRGRLTAKAFLLFDTLLWSCRQHGTAMARVSYSRLERLACQSRKTVAAGLAALERLGLLRRNKQSMWVEWEGARVRRQGVTIYELLAGPECTSSTVDREQGSISRDSKPRAAPDDGVEAALASLGRALNGAAP